jgi:hypothetical protein
MSVEIPQFWPVLLDGYTSLRAGEHRERPVVLFKMLGLTSLNAYNVAVPKERNMYLEPVGKDETIQHIVTEMTAEDTLDEMASVVHSFRILCTHLRNIDERQFVALVDLAKTRITL